MKGFSKNSLILLVSACISVMTFVSAKKNTPFYADSLGYYLYLPAALIYNDVKHMETIPKAYNVPKDIVYYANCMAMQGRTSLGYCVNQYTYGIALTELPFFCIAHLWEKMSGNPANGYSDHYALAIVLSTICYLLLGLYFTYKILLHFVSEWFATLSTCLLLLASNLYWFSIYQPGMSHIPLFCLYAGLIYLTLQLHQNPKRWQFIVTGFIAGLITVIRPTDILCLLITFTYGLYNRASWQQKKELLQKNKINVLLAALFFFIAVAPQLLYWKVCSGSFIYDSYRGQSFHWNHPEIFRGLFSGSNGWLMYSPVFILALAGLFYASSFKSLALPTFFILPSYIYVIYSWFCYNYINGFGSRPMIHLYPLLAIPLAVILQKISRSALVFRVGTGCFLIICCIVNLAQSRQQSLGDLSSEQSNARFNWQTLFKRSLRIEDLVILDVDEFQPRSTPTPVRLIGQINYADSVSAQTDTLKSVRYQSTGNLEYPSMVIRDTLNKKDISTATYIKCSGIFRNTRHFYDNYKNHLLVVSIDRGEQNILWKAIRINNKAGLSDTSREIHINTYREPAWGRVPFYVTLPKFARQGDMISLRVWNPDKTDLFVSELKLELCR